MFSNFAGVWLTRIGYTRRALNLPMLHGIFCSAAIGLTRLGPSLAGCGAGTPVDVLQRQSPKEMDFWTFFVKTVAQAYRAPDTITINYILINSYN